MTDIVDRLNDSLSAGYSELRKEAAAEITRLRAKIEAMEKQEPAGTLHDDGYFVWSPRCRPASNYVGWKTKLYTLPVAQPAPPPVVVYRSPPQPLYECVTPDGDRYTSETGEGNPRWVPLWTLGWPADARRSADRGAFRPAPSLNASTGRQQQSIPAPSAPPAGQHPAHWASASGGGTWIRDACTMLPPAEVCDRLRDRRDAIRTRFFNAQEKERDALRLEERSVLARLDNDCGGR